ncbi:MAG TPA: flagellar biosynthetic protein FliO [Pseudogracilibacillus sp.]|nr:flagellar biosynthetic protein FliO [Pseudogracilibacillus sp.]
MTIKKRIKLICFLLPLIVLLMTDSVLAQPANVLDCLENEADCEEEEESDLNEQKEKLDDGELDKEEVADLVGNESFKASTLFFNIIKMIIALLFVLALIYIILLILRKRNKLMHHHDLLQNLGGISLGQNKSIQLIRIGSHIYVVGVGEHVDLMLEITEAEVVETLLSADESDKDDSFLQSLLAGAKGKTKQSNQFMSQLSDELSKLKKNREELVDKAAEKDDEHV